MKKYIPKYVEDEILSINWLSQLRNPITNSNALVEQNLNKVNMLISSTEWENITLEEANNISSYLYKKNLFDAQNEWNLIAENARDFITNKVIPKIPNVNGIEREYLVNDISWNLLHFIIENHYKEEKIISSCFFSELFEFYRLGRLPCGWSGDFPKGKLIIA